MKILKISATSFIFILVCLVFIYPLCSLFYRLSASGSPSLFSSQVLSALRISFIQASLSSLLASLVGLGLALFIFRWVDKKYLSFITRLLSISYCLPTLVVVNFWVWVFILSRRLEWNFSYSLSAVIVAHFLLNAPWAAAFILHTRSQVSEELLHSSQLLGARSLKRFYFVTWPAIRICFFSVLSQIFLVCVMSFSIVLLLGGGPPVESLETGIYQSLRYGLSNADEAVAFGFWQFVLCASPWLLILFLHRNLNQSSESINVSPSQKNYKSLSFILIGASGFASLLYFIPFLNGLSLRHLHEDPYFFEQILKSALQSLRIAGLASFLSLLISIAWIFAIKSSSSRWMERALKIATTLPGALSPLVLSLSVWLIAPRSVIIPSYLWVSLILAVQALPLCLRILWPLALQMREDLIVSARLLGASPMRSFFYADFFRWKTPILFLAAISFSVAFGELGAVSFFMTEDDVPLSLLLKKLMSQYRFEEAEWVALLLASVSVFAMFATWIFDPSTIQTKKWNSIDD